MSSPRVFESAAGPRPQRFAAALATSAGAHALLLVLIAFDVLGPGGGFGLGIGPGFGVGAGGGAGLGEKRREIFSLKDLPEPVPPSDPSTDEQLKELLKPTRAQAAVLPNAQVPRPKTSPVVQFARPARPLGSGVDLGSRFSSAGAGMGGFGGGGGGGAGISLGTSFGRYVGSLRKVGLDVALVVDSTGSMQHIVDELKERLDDLATTLQKLVPTARIGAVAFRDRTDEKVASAPRQSEDFLVRWSDLTFNSKKVKTFLGGIVAEGGGDYEEAVKAGLETAMRQMKWRADAKRVIILVGSSPPHQEDLPAIKKLVDDWHARGGVVSTIDVSQILHAEFERKLHKWVHGDELKEVSPLPDFYKQVQESYRDLAREGGGEMVAMDQTGELLRHVLALTFGRGWEKDVARIARGM